MSAAEAVTQARAIALDLIDPSPSNPRKAFDPVALDELAGDLKVRGLLQAVLVRPSPAKAGRYELVFGERRLRAARLAGWSAIPAVVREMTDLEVAETQLVENAQRADVHPLEEADAYKALRDTHKVAVAAIAAKVHKTPAHVVQRLALCNLVEAGRAAFLAGRLSLGSALAVARIPAKLQDEAVRDVTGARYQGEEPMSPRRALEYVRQQFMLRLGEAQFDRKDAALVPGAGACDACPKRTGNQTELFADVDSPDLCTDPLCWKAKLDAHWARRMAEHKARKLPVLSAAESAQVFPHRGGGLSWQAEKKFADLDIDVWVDTKRVALRTLLKGSDAPVTLARDNAGAVHELVPRAAVEKVVRAAAKQSPKTGGASRAPKADDATAKRRLEAKARPVAAAKILTKLVGDIEKKGIGDALARALVIGAVDSYFEAGPILARRGIATETKAERTRRDGGARALEALAKKLKGNELLGLFVEVYLHADTQFGSEWYRADGCPFARSCDALGIDFPAGVRAEVAALKAEAVKKPAAKAKRTKGKAAAGLTARAKVQHCRVCRCTEERACVGGCTWIEPDLCSACEGEVT